MKKQKKEERIKVANAYSSLGEVNNLLKAESNQEVTPSSFLLP